MPRLPRALVFTVLTLAVFLVVWYPVELDDHWWHMLTGRYVLEHRAIPTTDPFSFTMNGSPWVNWEWPAGVLMYSVFHAVGPWGLVALRFVAVLATLAVVWRHFELDEVDAKAPATLPGRLLLLALLLLVIFGRVADRPHVYALPFIAASHLLATLAVRRGGWRYVAMQCGLMVPWALFHPSWVLGVGMHTALMIDGWLDARAGRVPEGRRPTGWFYRLSPAVLVVPALVFHPIGHYVTAVTGYFSAMRAGSASVSPREWLPLWEFLHWTNAPLVACLLVMIARLLAVVFERSQLRRPSNAIVLGMLVGAWLFVRFTPEFAVLAIPQLHRFAAARWAAWKVPERTARLATGLLAAVTILVVVATKDVYQRAYSAEVDPRLNPVRVGDFMEKHGLGGNVLSTELNADAYLAFRRYPDVHEYIDGRIPQLFPAPMFTEYRDALVNPGTLDRLLDEKPIDHVVLQGVFSSANVATSALLFRRGDFELIHIDATGMLWTRTKLLETLAERPMRYRFVIPPLIDDAWFAVALKPKRFAVVAQELEHLLEEEPNLELGIVLAQTLAQDPRATDEQRERLAPLFAGH